MRIFYGCLALAMSLIVLAALWADPFFAHTGGFLATWWGATLFADVIVGFIVFGGVIWLFEPRKSRAFLWIAALCILGNLVAALWIALNWQGLSRHLRGQSSSGA
ncbi:MULTISPECIES: hypothetical protein [unclassified Iodidimonas]|jgi:hypothetical protein|uniref:hypothetical protein n=1 Tax=unclassified Iodidimonas TaxID=2626145 RepID=UPI002482DF24|nr:MULTISPECIES: hypothetical protein [unclassified Iodidimonas]